MDRRVRVGCGDFVGVLEVMREALESSKLGRLSDVRNQSWVRICDDDSEISEVH